MDVDRCVEVHTCQGHLFRHGILVVETQQPHIVGAWFEDGAADTRASEPDTLAEEDGVGRDMGAYRGVRSLFRLRCPAF
ncbi:MAG: hypothetical protein ACOYD3_07490 [Kiritimatiellia bacterium]|jgi:hypothetical protein